jgi:Ca-activated chloride channel homolog
MQITAPNQKRLALNIILLFYLAPSLSSQDKAKIPEFRVSVDMVYVKVAVMDPLRRYVTGMEKDYFKVYEDKILQTISYFSEESAPISVGIILDISGSMGFNHNMRISKGWFTSLMKKRNPGDEFFLIAFNDKVKLLEPFTEESADLQREVILVKSGGFTAIYDAIYMGLEKVKEGKQEKKALIVISDGEENSSRYNRKEVRESFKESDVPVYCVGYLGPEGYGGGVLREIAQVTGGRVFGGFWDNSINLVLTELRNQYLIGYAPTNNSRDGKWRKITVQMDAPPGYPKLMIGAKKGYYAPKH